jgi:hypothetical protein
MAQPERFARRILKGDVAGRLELMRLGRERPGGSSDIRADVAELMSPAPMTSLSGDEKSLLTAFLEMRLKLRSRADLNRASCKPGDINRAFSSHEAFQESDYGDGSRAEYSPELESEFDRFLTDAISRSGNARVADFGAAGAEFISKRRAAHQGTVHACATSLHYQPHASVDDYVQAPFEWLPKRMESSFDAVVSHMAWRYSILPHIALRNMARSLAPGGRAALEYSLSKSLEGVVCFPQPKEAPEVLGKLSSYLDSKAPMPEEKSASKGVRQAKQMASLIRRELASLEGAGFDVSIMTGSMGDPGPVIGMSQFPEGQNPYIVFLRRKR